MPIAGRFVVQSVSALLIIGLVALLGVVAMTVWLNERSRVNFDEAIQSRDVRGLAVELRSAVQSAESSQRGFVLTGNEIYLSPYDTAKTLARRRLDSLQEQGSALGSRQMIDRLGTSVIEKLAEMDQTIRLKVDRKDAEALAVVRTNRGKALMDEVSLFTSGIVRAADDRLTSGVVEQRVNAARLRWVSIAAAILIVLVVGGVVTTGYRYAREINQARDQVTILNANLEDRVRARTADLAQANEEIQRFAHIVSHDLRAPLVNIVGFTGELETGVSQLKAFINSGDVADPVVKGQALTAANVEIPEAIDFIRSSTVKMDNLIAAILKLSRAGRRELRPAPVALADMIKANAAAIHHQLAEAGGDVRPDLEVPTIVTDKLSLEQIVGNLFDNAVKYRSKVRPLRIDIRTRRMPDDGVRIEIADNGRGIAEADIGRVFELFRRAGARDQPGEGVGLAYVQSLVRNLGGTISVASVVEAGTTFTIDLPAILRIEQTGWKAAS